MTDNRKRIGILFGGKSVEHRISINSAKNLYKFIDKTKYEPILIGISLEGEWFHCEDPESNITDGSPINIDLSRVPGIFSTENGLLSVDMAFPILHGTNGEDGSVQGLLQVMDIPFVGTGVLGSSICMSKLISKELMALHSIPTSKYLTFSKSEQDNVKFDQIESELGLPIMVKAANLGSSVGINKVSSAEEFDAALDDSFKYDHTVIIEEFIEAREVECAVMGNEDIQVSNPGEIVIEGDYEFYTFDAKYVDEAAVSIVIPAEMDDEVREKVRAACKKAYQILKCEDFARVDLFLKNDGSFFLNEINTIPGFTNSSMFPMMWKERGISFTDLITNLITFAETRTARMSEVKTVFSSKLD